MPTRLYMKGPSFRDILAEFLEEKTDNSPLENASQKRFQPEPSPLLEWKTGTSAQIKKNGYPPPTSRKTATHREEKPARPLVVEKIFAREQLPVLGHDALGTLLHLGAVELNGEISLGRVKKAHRRLAKALHPDRIMESLSAFEKNRRREQFLMLQAAYETLSRELKSLEASSSDLVSGSESASGQGSRRQDAA